MITPDFHKIVKYSMYFAVCYLFCFGLAMVIFPIRPFWNDEWRLIYNIKFKSESLLWGRLDLLQECPRTYLILIKKITSYFDYNYAALRLPALVISFASMLLCFHLKNKIYSGNDINGYLFILILISSQTFTDYLVQVKHYEMEILCCLVALWQFLTIFEILEKGVKFINKYKYLLLCISFLICPFFSYTYPIAFAPVIPTLLVLSIKMQIRNQSKSEPYKTIVAISLPLILAFISITIFYQIDVKHVLEDRNMYQSYIKMLGYDKGGNHFFENFWQFFSLVGSGFVYEIIFGLVGITAFLYVTFKIFITNKCKLSTKDYLKLYCIILIILTLVLILTGKLMGGVARLTSFTVPAIAILIIIFFRDLKNKYNFNKLANTLATILYFGLFGNIITTSINTFTYPEYTNKIKTYWNTSLALKQARIHKIPLLFTYGVIGDKIKNQTLVIGKIANNTINATQIAGVDSLCPEVVVKVNPEYKVWDSIAVYQIPDMQWTKEYVNQLPTEFNSAIVCDGINFYQVNR